MPVLAVSLSAAVVVGTLVPAAGAAATESYEMTFLSERTDVWITPFQPLDLTRDLAGVLYVSDSNGRVIRIEPESTTIVLGGPDQFPWDQPDYPSSIAMDSTDNLYVSDWTKNRVQKVTPAGVLSVVAESGPAGDDPLSSPASITVDASDNLYISDTGNDRIVKVAGDGSFVTVADLTTIPDDPVSGAYARTLALAIDPAGLVNFCDANRSFRVTAAGAIEEFTTGATFSGCSDLGFDAAGNMYVLSPGATTSLWVSDGSAGQYPTDAPPNYMNSIYVRSDGTIDASNRFESSLFTVPRGGPVSLLAQNPFSGWNPRLIERGSNGRIQVVDTDITSPIWDLAANDELVHVGTSPGIVDWISIGGGLTRTLNRTAVDGSSPGTAARINADGSVSDLWLRSDNTTGVFVAPDDSLWETVWRNGQPGNVTLVRHSAAGEEILWDENVGPDSGYSANQVVFAPDGTAYVGTSGGIVFRRSPDGVFTTHAQGIGTLLDIDAAGRLLTLPGGGNEGGLRWVETDGSFTEIVVVGGLPNAAVGPPAVRDAVVDGDELVILVADGLTNRVARLGNRVIVPTTTTTSTSTTAPTTTTTSSTTTSSTTTTVAPAACSRRVELVDPRSASERLSARLYVAYFLRQPDPEGYAYWASEMQNGVHPADVSWGFANSIEFVNRYGTLTDSESVGLVYDNVMCRDPDGGGLDYWLGMLDSGSTSRHALMLTFADSPEFRNLTGTN